MSGDLRRCRIHGCSNMHARNLFSCGDHWHELPKSMRAGIWSAYHVHGVHSNEYMQAAENAEAYLENRHARDMEVFG